MKKNKLLYGIGFFEVVKCNFNLEYLGFKPYPNNEFIVVFIIEFIYKDTGICRRSGEYFFTSINGINLK